MKTSLYVSLFVAFIDYIGIGIIYPIFSSMLFDHSCCLLPLETTNGMRGVWLGLLLTLMPLAQFFSSPIWGAISDSKGRKTPLQISLIIAILGYCIALGGIFFNSLILLLFSRVVIGFAAGNMSIVQASIVDVSSPEDKVKNFSLYSMAMGVGFTLGPLFGGVLSSFGYGVPFIFAALITMVNALFVYLYFEETHHQVFEREVSWMAGIMQLKKAFHHKELRVILLCSFLNVFAWTYFFEFMPVYLIQRFQFSPAELGVFYGVAGAFYALSTGILIRPLTRHIKAEILFVGAMFLTGLAIMGMVLPESSIWLWPCLFLVCYFTAPSSPTSCTIVSDSASSQIQGEALGILGSVNAIAYASSPLISGSLVGDFPSLPMWMGGGVMLLSACIGMIGFRDHFIRLFNKIGG